MMKEQVNMQDIRKMNQDGVIFFIMMIVMIVSVVPLFMYLKGIGVCIWGILVIITGYYAIRIERQKKIHDVQTYHEILAFMNGKKLDEIETARESGKRIYQKICSVICSGIIGAVVVYSIYALLNLL